ncbi:helix-turn-helix domain-containing protein [Halobacteriaceae archaeon GCM10025711]
MIEECLVVEFQVEGDTCPLATASRETGVRIESGPPQRRDDGNSLLRFSAPANDGLTEALDADDRIRYLHVSRSDGHHNYRCLSKDPCAVHRLIDAGFLVESVQFRDGVERYTGAVVGHDVLKGVLDTAGDTVGVTLERVYPLGSEDEAAVAKQWNITHRQEEALRAARRLGYFEVPRQVTASEVADDLGISKSAFLERIHRAEGSLFDQLL